MCLVRKNGKINFCLKCCQRTKFGLFCRAGACSRRKQKILICFFTYQMEDYRQNFNANLLYIRGRSKPLPYDESKPADRQIYDLT